MHPRALGTVRPLTWLFQGAANLFILYTNLSIFQSGPGIYSVLRRGMVATPKADKLLGPPWRLQKSNGAELTLLYGPV